ncbi:hypothetical protein TNCV_4726431 [Trichonephila clavipes]|nr:hypothetical protein TNCV_4726431 [Trichonephila clavipes]
MLSILFRTIASRPSGIVVSDADCRAERRGFANPVEDMDLCKFNSPYGTEEHFAFQFLNDVQRPNPLVWWADGEDSSEAPDISPWCSPSKLGCNRAKSYCHLYGVQNLRLTTDVHLAPCPEEFRGSLSDYVRQVTLTTIAT